MTNFIICERQLHETVPNPIQQPKMPIDPNPFLSFLSPLNNCKKHGQYQLHESIEGPSSAASSLVDNLAKTLQKEPWVRVAVPGGKCKAKPPGYIYIYGSMDPRFLATATSEFKKKVWVPDHGVVEIEQPVIYSTANLQTYCKTVEAQTICRCHLHILSCCICVMHIQCVWWTKKLWRWWTLSVTQGISGTMNGFNLGNHDLYIQFWLLELDRWLTQTVILGFIRTGSAMRNF